MNGGEEDEGDVTVVEPKLRPSTLVWPPLALLPPLPVPLLMETLGERSTLGEENEEEGAELVLGDSRPTALNGAAGGVLLLPKMEAVMTGGVDNEEVEEVGVPPPAPPPPPPPAPPMRLSVGAAVVAGLFSPPLLPPDPLTTFHAPCAPHINDGEIGPDEKEDDMWCEAKPGDNRLPWAKVGEKGRRGVIDRTGWGGSSIEAEEDEAEHEDEDEDEDDEDGALPSDPEPGVCWPPVVAPPVAAMLVCKSGGESELKFGFEFEFEFGLELGPPPPPPAAAAPPCWSVVTAAAAVEDKEPAGAEEEEEEDGGEGPGPGPGPGGVEPCVSDGGDRRHDPGEGIEAREGAEKSGPSVLPPGRLLPPKLPPLPLPPPTPPPLLLLLLLPPPSCTP